MLSSDSPQFNILIDSLVILREFQCKGCRKLAYSNGGAVFAVALGISISVYSTYEGQLLYTFIGHVKTINSLSFARNDTFLYSTGVDGTVYAWDLAKGCRIDSKASLLPRTTTYTGIVTDVRNEEGHLNRIVVCGADGSVMEMNWKNDDSDSGHLQQTVTAPFERFTCICLSANRKVFVAGTSCGSLLAYDWPLTEGSRPIKIYEAHYTGNGKRGVIDVKAVGDLILSIGEDGSLFALSLHEREQTVAENSVSKSGRILNPDTVLVSIDKFEEAAENNQDLKRKIEDLVTEHDFALHRKDTSWQGELKELAENTDTELKAEQ